MRVDEEEMVMSAALENAAGSRATGTLSHTKEGLVSISERRKSRVEAPPIVSKSRRTQRRAIVPHGHPFGVNTAYLPRRRFLRLAAGAAAVPAISRTAVAQPYPARPVTIIVPTTAGGGTDIIARLIGDQLAKQLGQPFVIENRPGAGLLVGTVAAANAAPDGYTLLAGLNGSMAVNPSLFIKLPYDPIRDFTPVAMLADYPFLAMVSRNPSEVWSVSAVPTACGGANVAPSAREVAT
jgi:hypothetical protein